VRSKETGRLLPLLGGNLCLDFVNTVDPRLKEPREEFLTNYRQLIEWGAFVGLIDPAQRNKLVRRSLAKPAAAAATFKRAIGVREALYDLLRNRNSTSGALMAVNAELSQTFVQRRLEPIRGGYLVRWQPWAEILGPVLESAQALLTSKELALVRECAGHGCGWLFIDTSRGHKRRWCSMAICGNRAKAQRNRRRKLVTGSKN